VCGGGLLELLTVDDDDAIPWKSSPLGGIGHLLEILTILERLTSRRQRTLISTFAERKGWVARDKFTLDAILRIADTARGNVGRAWVLSDR
jgi:hypothetical protein